MADKPPSFDEFAARGRTTRASQWLIAHPDVAELARQLLGEDKALRTVNKYLNEYYGWPFQAEALKNNLERLNDHT